MTVFLFWDGGVAYRGAAGIGAPLVPAAGRDEPTGEVRKAHTQGTDVLLQNICITKEVSQDRNYELSGDEGFELFFGDGGVLVVGGDGFVYVVFGPELAGVHAGAVFGDFVPGGFVLYHP